MNLFKVLLIAMSLWLAQAVTGQTISKSLIGSSGLTQSNDNIRLSWSLGETVIGTMTGGNQQLGNGFFQSLDYSVLAIPETDDVALIEVYPNPASVFFICRQKDMHNMRIIVTGIDGKMILDKSIESGDKIDVLKWKNGLYMIEITDEVTSQRTYLKILK